MWAIANISIARFFELLEGQRVGIFQSSHLSLGTSGSYQLIPIVDTESIPTVSPNWLQGGWKHLGYSDDTVVSHVKPKTHSNHHDLAEMGGNMWSPIRTWRFGFGQMRRVSLKWGSPKASKISLLQGKPMVLGHPKFENHAYSEKTYIQWMPYIPIAVCALYSAPFHCSSSTFTNFPSWFPQQSDSFSIIFYNFHSFPIHFPFISHFVCPYFCFGLLKSIVDLSQIMTLAAAWRCASGWFHFRRTWCGYAGNIWEHTCIQLYTKIITHTHAHMYIYIHRCIYVLKTSENLGYSHSVPWKYSRILIVKRIC